MKMRDAAPRALAPIRTTLFGVTLLTSLVSATAHAVVTFQDGEFNDPANQWFTVNTQNTGTNSSSVAQVGTGGSQGNVLQGTVNLIAPFPSSVNASAFNPQFVFNPSVDGAITDFDFSMDATGHIGGFAFGIALRQNGNIFQRRLNNILQPDPFITQTQLGLMAADFAAIDNAGSLDFSAAGSAIDFGFFFSTSRPNGTGRSQFAARFDDFQVTINNETAAVPAPEPGSMALMAGGFALFASAARRRRHSIAK